MAIFHRKQLMLFLEEMGIRPKKGLSQNFLIDQNILSKIASEAAVSHEDLVLEIGPGPGALTETLLSRGAEVIAIEKDKNLARALERLQTEDKRLSVIESDVLQVNFEELLGNQVKKGGKIKVIANLPYNITSPILIKLLPLTHLLSSLTVMVQDEVARRITSPPGNRVYGSLSVFSAFYSDPSYAFKVSKNCFYPAPKINSAILHFRLKEPLSVDSTEKFFNLTRTAFCYRRKMLKVSLKALYEPEKVVNVLESLGIKGDIRPECLSLEQFVSIYKLLN